MYVILAHLILKDILYFIITDEITEFQIPVIIIETIQLIVCFFTTVWFSKLGYNTDERIPKIMLFLFHAVFGILIITFILYVHDHSTYLVYFSIYDLGLVYINLFSLRHLNKSNKQKLSILYALINAIIMVTS